MPGSRGEVDALLAQADDHNKNVRNRVARELGKLADSDAREAIAEATRSAEWRRRFAAARAMWMWPDAQRLPASELQALLTDQHDSLRWAAVRTVPMRERLHAVGPLAATDPSPTVRRAALFSLSATPAAESIALESLKDDDHRVRGSALYFFGQNPNIETIGPLTLALTDRFMSVRMNAIWAIEAVGGSEATRAIIPLLHDRKRPVRRMAARALGQLGGEIALDSLLDFLRRSTSAPSRLVAIACLADMNDRRAVEPIIHELWTAWDEDPSNPRGRADRTNISRAATIALLRLGGDDAEREIERLPESWVEPLRDNLRREEARRRATTDR